MAVTAAMTPAQAVADAGALRFGRGFGRCSKQLRLCPCDLSVRLRRRLDWAVTVAMASVEAVVDAGVSRCGRLYIALAGILISLVALVFFAAIIPEVGRAPHRLDELAPPTLTKCCRPGRLQRRAIGKP